MGFACTDTETLELGTAAATVCAKLSLLDDLATGVNVMFLLFAGALVFIMHAGFAMLCAGAIRSKNTMNILLQTILDAASSAVAFYVLGYGFAYGIGDNAQNGFIGDASFGLSRFKDSLQPSGNTGTWTDFFFQWAFAATAVTIPAGAVAERFNFNAYLGYSFFIAAWVYPVVAHWAWSANGWMSAFKVVNPVAGIGYMDFAGSGVVHMTGGLAGLVGAIMVGPRLGRFDSAGNPVDMPGHSATLVVLGTCLLWFGWYGFNPGSMLNVTTQSYWRVVGRAAVTTTLGGAAGTLTALVVSFVRHRSWDLVAVCNGTLVGFVSITAGAHVLEPWAALLAGSIGLVIFEATCALWLKLQIDDPLAASPMHGVCGMWGVFIVGLLAKKEYVIEVYTDRGADTQYGAFYGGGGKLLACQIMGIVVIAGWVCTNMAIFFGIFKFFGKLRISAEDEQAGLDVSKHGGSAYNYDMGFAANGSVPERSENDVKVQV